MKQITKDDLIKYGIDGMPHTLEYLTFVTEPINGADALRCVAAIGSYNYFSPRSVSDAICTLIVRDPAVTFRIGRDLSPVMFIQKLALSDAEVFAAFRPTKPDEMDVVRIDDGSGEWIRVWWD